MLKEDFFNDNFNLNNEIQNIMYDFHINGPINQNHLETLAYLKQNSPIFFREYEAKLMYLMGLFYKIEEPSSFLETIYKSYADTIKEETGHEFTPMQGDAYKIIKEYTNFSFSAPTSAGKSYLFQEIIKEVNGDIIIVIPSRALLSEYISKLKRLTTKETLILSFVELVNTKKTKKRIFVITPERGEELFSNIEKLDIKLILLDEAQLSEEGIRGMKFDSFVRRIDKKLKNVKKVFTHPFIINPEAQFLKHNITQNIKHEIYKQKTVGKIFIEHNKGNFKYFSPFQDEINGRELNKNIIEDIIKKNGTVLIFISKAKIYDGTFMDNYLEYINLCQDISDPQAKAYIKRLEDFFGTTKGNEKKSLLIFLMKKGIVIHHGSIPLKARLIIEEFVNNKHARICFSTSTLIQGINMPFDLVWINNFSFSGNENQKILNLKNLIGRAGRTTLENNCFDFGYVVIEKKNKKLFISRLNKESSISETSELDNITNGSAEDFIDIIEAIKNDSFDSKLHLTNTQIERIKESDIDKDVEFILDNFLNEDFEPLTTKEYYYLKDSKRKQLKKSFENIYTVHLRRKEMTVGEKHVLSTAIPILLWIIQGKSFSEIVSLRYAFLSEKDFRRSIKRQLINKEITKEVYTSMLQDKKIRYTCIANSLPDSTFKKGISLFKRNTSIKDIDFDSIIYDTYDYIDKVLSLSLRDPISSVFYIYFQKTNDQRALILNNFIKYGTNDATEIWLLKYGFSFDDIEKIKPFVKAIDETEIKFNTLIKDFIKEKENFELIERYL